MINKRFLNMPRNPTLIVGNKVTITVTLKGTVGKEKEKKKNSNLLDNKRLLLKQEGHQK